MALIDFDKIKDVLGLSKPLTKLIEVIAQGTGAITQPYLIKKNADAKAYEIGVISKAIEENQNSIQKIDYKEARVSLRSLDKESIKEINSLTQRAENRIEYQEQKRQQNIECVTQIAAEQLDAEITVSEEKVDEDWIARFFSFAQDVSNEEMQGLWGRILAGEVKSPKSFSLRALDIIRNLSKSEAEIFSKVSNYAIKSENDDFLFKGRNNLLTRKFNLSFNEIALLKELGLLHTSEITNYTYSTNRKPSSPYLLFGKTVVIMKNKANTPEYKIPVYLFTTIGKELLKLILIEPNFEYIKEFAKQTQTVNTTIMYGDLIELLPNSIKHSIPLKKVLE